MPRLNCTQVNLLTKDKFLIVWVLSSSLFSLFLWFSVGVFFFFSVIHQFLMITELLIEKGIKKN